MYKFINLNRRCVLLVIFMVPYWFFLLIFFLILLKIFYYLFSFLTLGYAGVWSVHLKEKSLAEMRRKHKKVQLFGKYEWPHSPFLSFIFNPLSVVPWLYLWFIYCGGAYWFVALEWWCGQPCLAPTSWSNVCIIRIGALWRVQNGYQGKH